MKFLAERDVPEKLRLLHPRVKDQAEERSPDPPDRVPEIVQALVDLLKQGRDVHTTIDTTPIAEAIRTMAHPTPEPKADPVKSWTFTIKRDTYGVMTEVVATKRT